MISIGICSSESIDGRLGLAHVTATQSGLDSLQEPLIRSSIRRAQSIGREEPGTGFLDFELIDKDIWSNCVLFCG